MAQRIHAIDRVRRVAAVAMACASLLALATKPVDAQGDSMCTLPPLTLPLFGGTPVAEVATTTPQAVPGPASAEEITAAVEQIVACVNTGDPALVYAVFSPRWLAGQFADPEVHYLPAFERMLDTTAPMPAEPLALTSVEKVEPLPDGRVRVEAVFTSGTRTWHDTLVLVDSNGSWLIDEVESAATP
jgi:hypothetical protein